MANHNRVTIIGRLTKDSEARELPGGGNVVSFSVATSRRFKDKSGERKEETTFVDCELFGPRTEYFSGNGKKGVEVFVDGRLKLDKWEDKQTGQERRKMVIHVEDFDFTGSRKSGNEDENNDEGGKDSAPPARQANRYGVRNTQNKSAVTPKPKRDEDIPF